VFVKSTAAKSHCIVTNSPVNDQQRALTAYWKGIGGIAMLLGTSGAADRFVRASLTT
jgi:choloylglycine hydrolase